MCYIILPAAAFVLVLWSSVAAIAGLWSTDWFVGNGLHYGIASGCPDVDSVTVPFNIPSSVDDTASTTTTATTTPSTSTNPQAYAKWTSAATAITKSYFADSACTIAGGTETFEIGKCYISAVNGKPFEVNPENAYASICVFGADDTTCGM